MKLKDLMDGLDTLEDRAVLRPLMKQLTPLTLRELDDYQQEHAVLKFFKGPDFEAFVKGQNEIIRRCIEIEKSDVGSDVRKHFKLPPLTDDTEIEDNDVPEQL